MPILTAHNDTSTTTPRLAVIGGRLEDDNTAIYQEMHRLSGGRIVIFATASAEPEQVGAEALAVFRAHGFDAVLAPVHGEGAAEAARDPFLVALIADYGSVYFTGGNQAFITAALAPEGRETPVLAAIRYALSQGGLIAGSSAGAAMMSATMIEGGTSLEATTFGVVRDPAKPGLLLGEGLGFFPWGIVDQHFIKRGRFGRLVMALAESGTQRGFGVDENTALFVVGQRAHVIGEYGAFVVDMRAAVYDRVQRVVENLAFSYLDDGDAFDLAEGRVLPAREKQPAGGRDIVYRAPARSLRNVFGAYTLYDLVTRLVLGDPEHYAADRARAIEPKAGVATSVELERLRGVSRAFTARRGDALRITAVDFRATMASRKLNAAQLAANRRAALARDYGVLAGAASRLVLLGSSPLRDPALFAEMLGHCTGPVGIISAASSDPAAEARGYVRALEDAGGDALDLRVTIDNADHADSALIARIAGLRTILLSGGNQIRLVETLLHRGEVTPVLRAIAQSYAAGGTIIAVSGAASALSGSMIAGGSSSDALRFGVASDMGRRGIVIQEGLGFFGAAIVDQNLDASRRLARLVVACAEESVRFGIGLCAGSGIVASADNVLLTVIGGVGAVLIEIDPLRTELQSDDFFTSGVRVHLALPGDVIDLGTGEVRRTASPVEAEILLERLVREVIEDCATRRGAESHHHDGPIALRFTSTNGGSGILDVESIRDEDS